MFFSPSVLKEACSARHLADDEKLRDTRVNPFELSRDAPGNPDDEETPRDVQNDDNNLELQTSLMTPLRGRNMTLVGVLFIIADSTLAKALGLGSFRQRFIFAILSFNLKCLLRICESDDVTNKLTSLMNDRNQKQ